MCGGKVYIYMVCVCVCVCVCLYLVLVPRCPDPAAHVLDGNKLAILMGLECGLSWGGGGQEAQRHVVWNLSPSQEGEMHINFSDFWSTVPIHGVTTVTPENSVLDSNLKCHVFSKGY